VSTSLTLGFCLLQAGTLKRWAGGPLAAWRKSANRTRACARGWSPAAAFIALNSGDWAEFIINTAVPLAAGTEVNHYARTRRMEGVRNTLLALP
jgi:hypothetical protein